MNRADAYVVWSAQALCADTVCTDLQDTAALQFMADLTMQISTALVSFSNVHSQTT